MDILHNSVIFSILLTSVAGLSTVFGALIFFGTKKINLSSLSFSLGISAGVMIYLSFVELLNESINIVGFEMANMFFFFGIVFMLFVDKAFPHSLIQKNLTSKFMGDKSLYITGVVITVGLFLHNIPEGVAVFMSSLHSTEYGLILFLAITIHNIPEGMAIAAPIYHSTKSKITALKYSFAAAIAEPIGGVVAYLFLKPYLSDSILAYTYAVVAGIMVYISIDELLPVCIKSTSRFAPIMGMTVGMATMALSLILLRM
jgi:ZIP family zinc transporter